LLQPGYRRDEAVPPSGCSLDAACSRPAIVEHAAERRYLHREIGFLDHRVRPDGGHEFVLRHEIAVSFDQNTEHVE
jgi:hypothetical protein